MSHEILISADDALIRIARVEDDRLVALNVVPRGQSQQAGNIYLGQTRRVMPHLNAAFIDIGARRDAFLGAREARCLVPNATIETKIEDCVREGDLVLVQLQHPARDEKGASVTADVSLPGRMVVLTPCRRGIALSRQIEDDSERARLTELVKTALGENPALNIEGSDDKAGWLLRTASAGVDAATLTGDMLRLAQAWEVLSDKAESVAPPALLHQDANVLARALRDYVQPGVDAIIIEDQTAFTEARAYAQNNMPKMVDKIQASEADEHLFDRYGIEDEIVKALSPRIDLPGGGNLVFEATSAMVTIDVNSGAQQAPALATNLEAAREIARQIQLRALGGLIAIDFIDMDAAAQGTQVLETLEAGFTEDKAPVRIGPMSEFHVVELTRRRNDVSLAQAMRAQF